MHVAFQNLLVLYSSKQAYQRPSSTQATSWFMSDLILWDGGGAELFLQLSDT